MDYSKLRGNSHMLASSSPDALLQYSTVYILQTGASAPESCLICLGCWL